MKTFIFRTDEGSFSKWHKKLNTPPCYRTKFARLCPKKPMWYCCNPNITHKQSYYRSKFKHCTSLHGRILICMQIITLSAYLLRCPAGGGEGKLQQTEQNPFIMLHNPLLPFSMESVCDTQTYTQYRCVYNVHIIIPVLAGKHHTQVKPGVFCPPPPDSHSSSSSSSTVAASVKLTMFILSCLC